MKPPEHADAIGTAGTMLAAQLMAHLLRKGVLSLEDVTAIFRDTRAGRPHIPDGRLADEDWDQHAGPVLQQLERDVVRLAFQTRPGPFS
jgi:hypothetical protein